MIVNGNAVLNVVRLLKITEIAKLKHDQWFSCKIGGGFTKNQYLMFVLKWPDLV